MPTAPKSATDHKGITIHLSAKDLEEMDLQIVEHLAKAPAATLPRATFAGYIVRQHLAAGRAARSGAPAPVEPPEPKGRRGRA